jgi:hypothetical protein
MDLLILGTLALLLAGGLRRWLGTRDTDDDKHNWD